MPQQIFPSKELNIRWRYSHFSRNTTNAPLSHRTAPDPASHRSLNPGFSTLPAAMPPSPTFESTPLLHCPSRDPIPYPVSYPTTWYALRSTPAFRACSNCYETSILPSGLSPSFYPVVESLAGPERFCAYNTPRARALVSRASSPAAAAAELEAHAKTRVDVSDCRLSRPVAPEEGLEWHRLRGGMDACHACHLDFLSASVFASEVPEETVRQPPTQMALCDVGSAFARRMAAEAGDYGEFLSALRRRARVASCAGPAGVSPGSRRWFRLRDPRAAGLAVCEQCFLDAAGGTQYETLFEDARPKEGAPVACGFGTYPALAVNFGLMTEFREPKLFLRAVEAVLNHPPCDAEGIHPQTPYYTLPSTPNFAICAPCAATLVAPIRVLDPHLHLSTAPLQSPIICALNAANPRVEQYIKKISEAAEKGEAEIFLSTASYLSTSPPCPRSVPSDAPHRWTGNGAFSACEDCARDVVLQSPLAVFMTYREARVPGERRCDFYSARVRGFWGQASRAGDLRGAMGDFGAIMRHREAVWRKMVKVREDLEGGTVEGGDVEEMRGKLGELEALWAEVE